ncbi:potassium channel family protein [Parasulfitobacter algicola]|uniref:Two pore domain potassium channel family protein n=1 Tax=Parasulfitobacter algicola TaxID=2614809 RepID=A0ABX2ITX8_9RHOB|nr:potassium channel family protein [Sulfitobacter algicola]NSX53638.1 two pore domain potassium channel family protein [Sulfitobacter algicola]
MIQYKALTLLGMMVTIITSGTVFFKFVEGWAWIDAYFFTVVTISTVGYGNLVPVTVAGKIGTTVLIFVGLGIFAVAIQQFGHFAIRRQSQARRILRSGSQASGRPVQKDNPKR